MRISDWSSDVCSSDLGQPAISLRLALAGAAEAPPARSAPVSRRAAFEPATSPPCGKDTVRRPPMSAYRKSPEAIASLTPEQYRVTQDSATARPGTGAHPHTTETGIYVDLVSGEPLFASSSQLAYGCGRPSLSPPHVTRAAERRDGKRT